ncbi:MAG: hypothetical protein IT168_32690 [Bryobacterales bacterium]|nr:hypothetical protein [Bryobacterales bacterium]
MPWQTVAAFPRVITNPKLRGDRATVEQAVAIVDQWLAQPNVRLLAPGDRTGRFCGRPWSTAKFVVPSLQMPSWLL